MYEEASYSWAKGHKKSQSWPQLAGQMSDKTLTVSCTSNCLLHLPPPPPPPAHTHTHTQACTTKHTRRQGNSVEASPLSPPLSLGSLASNLHSKKATCRARFGSNFDFWPQGCVFATPPSLHTALSGLHRRRHATLWPKSFVCLPGKVTFSGHAASLKEEEKEAARLPRG